MSQFLANGPISFGYDHKEELGPENAVTITRKNWAQRMTGVHLQMLVVSKELNRKTFDHKMLELDGRLGVNFFSQLLQGCYQQLCLEVYHYQQRIITLQELVSSHGIQRTVRS